MSKLERFKTNFILVLCFTFLFIAVAWGQIASAFNTDKALYSNQVLTNISNEEKAILDGLFIISQEIDQMNKTSELILKEINEVQDEISSFESAIKERQDIYNSHLDVLEATLVAYQKKGPASYLEIILSAENLNDFLKRVNLIKDLSKNTENTLKSLDKEKDLLVLDQDALKTKKDLLEQKNNQLQTSLNQKLELRQNQEAILESLSEEKNKYQQHLNSLEKSWGEIKFLLSDMSQELSRVIFESDISLNDFNLSVGLFSVKGRISDDVINRVVKNDTAIPEMITAQLLLMTKAGVPLDILWTKARSMA